MPFLPPLRAGLRCVAWSVFAAGLMVAPAGCELMGAAVPEAGTEQTSADILPRGADPSSSALGSATTPPGKHATRRGH